VLWALEWCGQFFLGQSIGIDKKSSRFVGVKVGWQNFFGMGVRVGVAKFFFD